MHLRDKKYMKSLSKFPMFCRHDNPYYWNKLKFYPGVIFFLTFRFFAMFGVFFVCCSIINIACIGHDFDKGPLKGFKR